MSEAASDCLRRAVDDADRFGVRQMCRVLWPVLVLLVISTGVTLLPLLAPALTIPLWILDKAFVLLIAAMRYTCCVCIYDEVRRQTLPASIPDFSTKG